MVTAAKIPQQFDIARHYDVMEQLDADVHDDVQLAQSEVDLVMRLLRGNVPHSVFLPCFGTGRHIEALLAAGAQRIVGVDLSPRCVEKAKRFIGDDPRVELIVGDLTEWRTDEQFDAVVLLGNSFGDIIDMNLLSRVTAGMVDPLKSGGMFVMDYIGTEYLDRCEAGARITWDAMLEGDAVKDHRTPRFCDGVMTLDVDVRRGEQQVWVGAYQKRILGAGDVIEHFAAHGVIMHDVGGAASLNPAYYDRHSGELGMIGRSHWWVGQKE